MAVKQYETDVAIAGGGAAGIAAGIEARADARAVEFAIALASERLAATAAGCVVLREFGTSDHAPVVATFDVA